MRASPVKDCKLFGEYHTFRRDLGTIEGRDTSAYLLKTTMPGQQDQAMAEVIRRPRR